MTDRPAMWVQLIGLDEVVLACDRVAKALPGAGVDVDAVLAVAPESWGNYGDAPNDSE